jgi:hypothetical protein
MKLRCVIGEPGMIYLSIQGGGLLERESSPAKTKARVADYGQSHVIGRRFEP